MRTKIIAYLAISTAIHTILTLSQELPETNPKTKWTLLGADPYPNAPITLPVITSSSSLPTSKINARIPFSDLLSILPSHPPRVPPNHQPSKRVIIGPTEDRLPLPRILLTTYPYTSIGRLLSTRPRPLINGTQTTYQTQCSGSLIGPRHVATAAHCIHPEFPNMKYRFQPSFNHEELRGGSFVEKWYRGEVDDKGTSSAGIQGKGDVETASETTEICKGYEDFAILILSDRIGDSLGWVGVGLLNYTLLDQNLNHDMGKNFSTFGYPGDLYSGEQTTWQDGVKVIRKAPCEGPLWMDADASGGMSGGPLWRVENGGGVFQYGVLSQGIGRDDGWITSFAAGRGFLALANRARREFP